jgi:ribonucleoside-diphosphate reductase alpha chain
MLKAIKATKNNVPAKMINEMVYCVEENFEGTIIGVEECQDIVEQVLMRYFPNAAKAYIIYRQQRTELRDCSPDPNAVSDYIHASKYARWLPGKLRRETFHETVQRVELMHKEKFPAYAKEIHEAFKYVHDKKILPSMRSMQFAGRSINYENARMYNCTFTLIDRPRVFSEILYLLLCGCGCGFSVQKQHVSKLPKLTKINPELVHHHKVEDSIQGWAEAVDALMQSYIHGYYIQFDFSAIRPAGSKLHRSGGKAPGHIALMLSLMNMRTILDEAEGRHLRPIECHDIICHLSSAVLAGGIRRSSLISLFSQDDEEMLHSKDGMFVEHRALCNNSVVLDDNTTKEDFLDLMSLNRTNFGDPGFVFLDNKDMGVNPCGEILIDPVIAGNTGFGFCNLVEVNVAHPDILLPQAVKYATFIATLQASYTDFKYLKMESKMIAERDALIGVSLTGIYDCPNPITKDDLIHWANIVKYENREVAMRIGINEAVRTTCIKPSGTASLELGGISSGIHPNHAKKYFRRITANPLEPVAQFFRAANPDMVEVKPDGDWCITFPMEGQYEEQTAMEFLKKIEFFYEHWILGNNETCHNISCTVSVADEEWDDVFEFVFQMKPTGMTFLPAQSDKDIPFCPREAVTTENDIADYLSLVRSYTVMDYMMLKEDEDNTVVASACDGDSCEAPIDLRSGHGEQVFAGWCTEPTELFWFEGHQFEFVEQKEGFYIARMS